MLPNLLSNEGKTLETIFGAGLEKNKHFFFISFLGY